MISRNASKSNKDVQSVGGKRLILRLVSEPRSWIRIVAGAGEGIVGQVGQHPAQIFRIMVLGLAIL